MNCTNCNRGMRTSGTAAKDAPGLTSYGGHGLCAACYLRVKRGGELGAPIAGQTHTVEEYEHPWPGDWVLDALCAQTDPEAFFPEGKGGSTNAAKQLCARCPVRALCLQYALDTHIMHGVWGGVSPRDRARLLREAS